MMRMMIVMVVVQDWKAQLLTPAGRNIIINLEGRKTTPELCGNNLFNHNPVKIKAYYQT